MNPSDPRPAILLVEANGLGPSSTAAVLTAAGYAVDRAADPDRAAVAAPPYALIVLDLMAPGLDGVAAASAIRRLPAPRGDVPILALTGSAGRTSNGSTADDCWCAAGIDVLLDKENERMDLLEAVAHWVEAADDPGWLLEARPGVTPPLVNWRTLAQLGEDLGEDLVPEVLLTFLEETVRRLGILQVRVAADDAAGAAEEAHALKGSAGTFGAMALRQAVQEMEQCGRAGDAARVAALLPQVSRLVTATCAQLRAQYSAVLADSP